MGVYSPRSAALVAVLVFCGLRMSEALGTDVRDHAHDHGHRVLRITCKDGKTARVPLATPVVRALDAYLERRTSGPMVTGPNQPSRYPCTSAYEQLLRLCRTAALPAGVSPHSLRHSYATEALSPPSPGDHAQAQEAEFSFSPQRQLS